MKGKTASEGTSVPPKRPPEVPKGFAGVAAAAAMNIRRQTLVEIMNNCTATVLQQGLRFPGFALEPQRVEAVWRAVDGLMHRSKWQSRSGIWEKSNSERRGKREERREKRDGSVPEGRDGREKGRALGETREERKEKREDPCRNNEQLYCNRVCTFPGRAAAREERREKREERREKRKERREKREEITKKAARDPQID